MSFDKFIDIMDVMGVNENYLICIFMNFNKNVENRVKTRGNCRHCKVFDGLYDLSCISETNSHGCQCDHRNRLNAIKYCPEQ